MAITDYDDNLASAQRVYKRAYEDLMARAKAGDTYQLYTSEVDIDGASMELDWLSNDPVMKEWIGERVYDALRANAITVPVKSYQKSFKESLTKILGDKSGLIVAKVAKWAASSQADKDKIAFDLLISGFSDVGHDGVAFFSTAHTNGPSGGTQSNTGTTALSSTSFNTARAAMRKLADENGEPFGIEPRVLMVGPDLEAVARAIVQAETRAVFVDSSGAESGTRVAGASESNIRTGYGMEVVVNPRLKGTSANYWFLIDDSYAEKPIVMGKLGGDPKESNDLTAPYRERPEARFSVDFHCALAYGAWQLIYGANVSA